MARIAAFLLAVMPIAMFPANVRAARQRLTIGGRPVLGVLPRAAIQVVFLAAVVLCGL